MNKFELIVADRTFRDSASPTKVRDVSSNLSGKKFRDSDSPTKVRDVSPNSSRNEFEPTVYVVKRTFRDSDSQTIVRDVSSNSSTTRNILSAGMEGIDEVNEAFDSLHQLLSPF